MTSIARPAPRRLASFAVPSVPGNERIALTQVAEALHATRGGPAEVPREGYPREVPRERYTGCKGHGPDDPKGRIPRSARDGYPVGGPDGRSRQEGNPDLENRDPEYSRRCNSRGPLGRERASCLLCLIVCYR